MPLPTPRVAPVTTATLPSRRGSPAPATAPDDECSPCPRKREEPIGDALGSHPPRRKERAVSERETRIPTSDGGMTTFFAAPDEAGPFPVVLVYMDALGLRDEL